MNRLKQFKKRLVERSWKIEGMFAEAKQNHRLRRAKFRNIQKFQIQVFMIAIFQKKIIFSYRYLLLFKSKPFLSNLNYLYFFNSPF